MAFLPSVPQRLLTPISKTVLLLSAVSFILTACAEPKLTRRWETKIIEPPQGFSAPEVSISGFTLAPEQSSSSRTVFNLSGEGQAAFINAMASSASVSASQLRQTLSKPISGATGTETDSTTIRRRLVVNVQRTSANEAERFLNTAVTVTLTNPAVAEFTGFEKFATQYDTIDYGTATFTQKSTLKADASIVPGSPHITGPNLAGTIESGLSEQTAFKRRIAASSLQYDAKVIRVEQQGAIDRDLSGPQVIDITLRFKNPTTGWVALVDGLDARKSADTARVGITRITIPPDGCADLGAMLELEAKVRIVVTGEATYTESDDSIYEAKAASRASITLITQSLLRRSAWELRDPQNDENMFVAILADNGNYPALNLASFSEAKLVLTWLKSHRSGTLGNRTLRIGGITKTQNAAQYSKNIDNLSVWINKMNWKNCG